MRQIYYVRPLEDRSWVVSRFGHPLAVLDDPEDAIALGNHIARRASEGGLPAELRLAHRDRSYELSTVFEDGHGAGL